MRFKLTIFLLLANLSLFTTLWYLETDYIIETSTPSESITFTELEISGKGIDQPRILKFIDNKWRITSPIDWTANLFAVTRIRNQIEFLDKEASFSLSELEAHGHSLAEYGLDNPSYTIKYGNGKKMYTLKIGKNAASGNRVYMLDENKNEIIVVDKTFVDGLIVDVQQLRNQVVFDIARFEVSSFSVRLPSLNQNDPSLKTNFRRVGIVKDGVNWHFETPIIAKADYREVDAFLNDVCQLSAKGFPNVSNSEAGFEVSALPTTITIEGTNRRQVLLLGGRTQDKSLVYAKLEDNPTIFTLDASILKNISEIQTTLRDKSLISFDISKIDNIDVFENGRSLKFRKLISGVWDIIGTNSTEEVLTTKADIALVNAILLKLSNVTALQFVSDAPGENIAPYGINDKSLKIVVTQSGKKPQSITIGGDYSYGGIKLMYAKIDSSDSIFGVSRDISMSINTDINNFRSRLIEALPDNSIITSLKIKDISNSETVFEISAKDGDFTNELSKLDQRKSEAVKQIFTTLRAFDVRSYLDEPFSKKGVYVDGENIDWKYEVQVLLQIKNGQSTSYETISFYLTRRVGGMTQYGGFEKSQSSFLLQPKIINSIFELTRASLEADKITKPLPQSPSVN